MSKKSAQKQIAQNQDRALAQAEQARFAAHNWSNWQRRKKLTQEIEEQQITAEKEAEKRLLHDENFKKMQAQLNHLVQNKHLLQKELFELRNQKERYSGPQATDPARPGTRSFIAQSTGQWPSPLRSR